jgi:hypothetical protein
MPGAKRVDKPLSHEKQALETARRVAARAADQSFRGKPVLGTDLFATLHTVSDLARGAPSDRISLLLLSDMLQCTRELCIEKPDQQVPGNAWIDAQRRQGTLPELPRVCVAAVGTDASSAHGVQVRDFWIAYFRAAGARLDRERWRHVVANANAVLCG